MGIEEIDAAFGSVPHAIIGAVAANRFMPARQTMDIDFAIAQRDVAVASETLLAAGWHMQHDLVVRPPLAGVAWQSADDQPIDVIIVPGRWGEALVDSAMTNRADGLPMASLPHLVILKMIAGRTTDAGDVARMLGHQDALTLEAVRTVARRVLQEPELADLDQLIELGRLEYLGPHMEGPVGVQDTPDSSRGRNRGPRAPEALGADLVVLRPRWASYLRVDGPRR